jgi:hypothetical protein
MSGTTRSDEYFACDRTGVPRLGAHGRLTTRTSSAVVDPPAPRVTVRACSCASTLRSLRSPLTRC